MTTLCLSPLQIPKQFHLFKSRDDITYSDKMLVRANVIDRLPSTIFESNCKCGHDKCIRHYFNEDSSDDSGSSSPEESSYLLPLTKPKAIRPKTPPISKGLKPFPQP